MLRHDCPYLAARDAASNKLVAVLPLVRVRSMVFGHFLVSMPFVNYGGPLGSEEGVRAVTARAEEMAKSTRVGLLELRSRTPLPIGLPVSHRKITVVLHLPSDPEALWKALPAKGSYEAAVAFPKGVWRAARTGGHYDSGAGRGIIWGRALESPRLVRSGGAPPCAPVDVRKKRRGSAKTPPLTGRSQSAGP